MKRNIVLSMLAVIVSASLSVSLSAKIVDFKGIVETNYPNPAVQPAQWLPVRFKLDDQFTAPHAKNEIIKDVMNRGLVSGSMIVKEVYILDPNSKKIVFDTLGTNWPSEAAKGNILVETDVL